MATSRTKIMFGWGVACFVAADDLPTAYRRALSLEDAVATCDYTARGVVYRREAFTSLADDVLVVRLTADRPGAISFSAFFESPFQRGRGLPMMASTSSCADARVSSRSQTAQSAMLRISRRARTVGVFRPTMA